MTRVLFVCLGNICRSPLAHGLLRDRIERRGLGAQLSVDSCGTSAYHNGEPPDPNMIRVAQLHGVDLSPLRSRRLVDADFFEFDLLVAMDRSNESNIHARKLPNSEARVVRFMPFVPNAPSPDVPDPYWGGVDGFEQVFQLIDSGMDSMMDFALELDAALNS